MKFCCTKMTLQVSMPKCHLIVECVYDCINYDCVLIFKLEFICSSLKYCFVLYDNG